MLTVERIESHLVPVIDPLGFINDHAWYWTVDPLRITLIKHLPEHTGLEKPYYSVSLSLRKEQDYWVSLTGVRHPDRRVVLERFASKIQDEWKENFQQAADVFRDWGAPEKVGVPALRRLLED